MMKTYLTALALGVMTTAALAPAAMGQADRLGVQSEPARDGNIAWHLGPSFPDSGGFTLVDPDGTVNVIPREQRPRTIRAGTDPSQSPPFCSHASICGRRRSPFPRSDLARVEWDQNMG